MYSAWQSSPDLQGSRILKGTLGGELSSIQFDSAALFLQHFPECAHIETIRVAVSDEGVTYRDKGADESSSSSSLPFYPVRVALDWKDRAKFDAYVLSLASEAAQKIEKNLNNDLNNDILN